MHQLCAKVLGGYQPPLDDFISEFSEIFPLLNSLKDTPQDPEWHAEGNVYIHTSAVLTELYNLINSEGTHLSRECILTLVLAAVFHDIAKPFTTKNMEINGAQRIAAPQHEYKGGSYIAYRLAELDLPFSIIYNVISLVIHHINPKLLVVKNLEQKDYKKIANITNVELLYFLEKADMIGRTCNNKAKEIANIDLFKMFCQEYQLWPNKNPYEDCRKVINDSLTSYSSKAKNFVLSNTIKDMESGIIKHPMEGVSRSFSYRDDFAELIILCGPSGGGKSTWIKNNLADYNIVSLDQLRIEITGKQNDQSQNGQVLQAAKKLLKQYLAKKQKVVWDATNLRKDFRSQISELGFAYKAFVSLVVFYGPKAQFYAGNKNREFQVTERVLDNQFRNLEWPEPLEVHSYKVINTEGITIFEM